MKNKSKKRTSIKLNKKRVIIITVTLILLVALIVPICFCAKNCIKSDSKYDYDMYAIRSLAAPESQSLTKSIHLAASISFESML